MIIAPNLVVCSTYFVVTCGSSLQKATEVSFSGFWLDSWRRPGFGNEQAWTFLLGLVAYSGLSLLLLKRKMYHGPTTPTGYTPKYYMGGFLYYTISMVIAAYIIFGHGVHCQALYYMLPTLTVNLVLFGFAVCVLLFVKGKYCPSPGGHGSSGSSLFDFYWGLELYPRIMNGRLDVKQWVICRFALMLWQLIVLICWKAAVEDSGWNWAMSTSAILQTAYLARCFWWEDGYLMCLDATEDRAGFYLIWGSLAYLPAIYPISTVYLVKHSPDNDLSYSLAILVLGLTAIGLGYWTDYQRQLTRATNGKCHLWGCPPKVIRASYKGVLGKEKTNLLLVSGFWSWSRHMNYVFEILTVLCWGLPAGLSSVVPHVCVLSLTVLLMHRSYRDDRKCRLKYKLYWEQYCSEVKYRMIPFVF